MTTLVGETRERASALYVVLVGAVVALIPWFAQPGRILADTKLDLTVDPWGYLARSQSAWDSHAFFGQLQNQAYGYLFPMGPFFGVGHSLGLPAWVIQRAWWTVVLLTAFAGTYLLVRRLRLAGPRGATVAAIAFALSPHALTVLGPISIEQWPSAMVPWLILASRRLATTRGRARIGAVAVVAVTCAAVGGVNATASLAAFGVAGLFMLTGAADRRVFPLWCLAVIAGTLWWSVPLVVLGRYAYPFLDFIETSTITTAVTSAPNVLRGTSHWVAFIGNGLSGGEWPAGADLATIRFLVVATTAVGVLGLVAITWRGAWTEATRVHRFAVVSLLVGTTVMVSGFGANLGMPFTGIGAGQVRELLDGPLAALRNVHKFDPLIRLPVCLGLAVVVHRWSADRRLWSAALVAAVLAGTAWPAVSSSLVPRGGYTAIPEGWTLAADRVDAMAVMQGGSTLLAPAIRFGDYDWGSTQDDPLESLATSPVVTRDAIPLGSPGAIRVMDALDGTLRSGAARPGLVDLLDRLGITRVLVSHDSSQDAVDREVNPGAVDADQRTERTLRTSGLALVQVWGSGDTRMSLWTTGRTSDRAEMLDAGSLTRLTGGPEALVDLSAVGLLGPASPGYVLGDSALPTDPSSTIQTDTLRKRSLDVASAIGNQYSPTLTSSQSRERADFAPAETLRPTTRSYRGLDDVRVSSSATDSDQVGYRAVSIGASGALDSDDDTSWLAGADDDDPRLSFSLPTTTSVGDVTVRLTDAITAGSVDEVELVVDGEVLAQRVDDQSTALTFAVDRPVDRVEVRLNRADGTTGLPVGIATVALEGVDAAARLTLPETDVDSTRSVVLSRDPWATGSGDGRRDDSRVLERAFTIADPLTVDQVLLRTRSTPAVEQLLDGWSISGPRVGDDVRTRPGAALDQDPDTSWTVGYTSPDPTLTIDLGQARSLRGLQVERVAKAQPVLRGISVRDLDTGEQRGWTRDDPEFPELTARRVQLTFDLPDRVVFPVRMPEVTLVGASDAPAADPDAVVDVPCSSAPTVQVAADDGAASDPARFSARVSRGDLLGGAVVRATACDDLPVVPAGWSRVSGVSSEVFDVWSVLAGGVPATVAGSTPPVREWTDRERDVEADASSAERVVAWHEGYNTGWRATLDGVDLAPVQIDGWRQGFVVPADASGLIEARFEPDTTYRGGLLAGGALVLLALGVAVAWGRGSTREAPDAPATGRPVAVRVVAGLVVAGSMTAMGGLGGLALAIVAWVVPARHRPRVSVAAGAALIAAAAARPNFVSDDWSTAGSQALGLFLLALAAAAASDPVRSSEERSLDETPRQVGHER